MDDTPNNERLIYLRDVPDLPWMPRKGGKPMSVKRLYRWIKDGVRGTHLWYTQMPDGRCTTESALRAMLEALAGRRVRDIKETLAQRAKSAKRLDASLKADGLI